LLARKYASRVQQWRIWEKILPQNSVYSQLNTCRCSNKKKRFLLETPVDILGVKSGKEPEILKALDF